MTFTDVCHYAELSGCPHREDGGVRNIPARHLRKMNEIRGFAFYDKAYEMIEKALNGVSDEPFWGI